MAELAVTNTLVDGNTIAALGLNTNFSDIVTWLNARYNGTDTWPNMKVVSTAANPIDISGSSATTELSINNTATDGDPVLSFELGGNAIHTMGVDDSDGDIFKLGTSSITTQVSFQVPAAGSQVQFALGSAAAPSVSGIGIATSGIFFTAGPNIGFSVAGSQVGAFDGNGNLRIVDGSAATPSLAGINYASTGIYFTSAPSVNISIGGIGAIGIDSNRSLRISDGGAATPSLTGLNFSTTGLFFSAGPIINFTVSGTNALKLNAATLFPAADGVIGLGKTGARYTDVWAVDGSIETSVASSKKDIEFIEIEETEIPSAVCFGRPDYNHSAKRIGFLADDLPEECFAIIDDQGTRSKTAVYTSAVVGLLCAAVKKIDARLRNAGIN